MLVYPRHRPLSGLYLKSNLPKGDSVKDSSKLKLQTAARAYVTGATLKAAAAEAGTSAKQLGKWRVEAPDLWAAELGKASLARLEAAERMGMGALKRIEKMALDPKAAPQERRKCNALLILHMGRVSVARSAVLTKEVAPQGPPFQINIVEANEEDYLAARAKQNGQTVEERREAEAAEAAEAGATT